MRAVVMTGIGGPEVLQVQDVPRPVPQQGELLVRVHAAGVNPIDYKLRKTGAMGAGPGRILGFDVAGVVEAVGPGVRRVRPGDAVFYTPPLDGQGAYAEFHVVHEDITAAKPATTDFVQAAAIPLSALTAWQALLERAALRLGETVLVHGGSGGVGTFAVQLAHAAGAFVFATCSTKNVALLRSLGVDRPIDYRSEDYARVIASEAPGGVADVAFDCVGGDCVAKSIPLMRPGGRIATIVDPKGELSAGYRKNVRLDYVFLQRDRRALEALAALVGRQLLKPVVGKTFPLEQAAEAQRQLEAGGGHGKIVLTVK